MSATRAARLREASAWAAPLLVLIVIAGAIEVLRPGSFAIDQLSLKCAAALTLIFVATGETIVVLRGGIDLAVGGIVSLATAIAATSAGAASGPDASFAALLPWLVLILGVGGGIGILNGVLICFSACSRSWSLSPHGRSSKASH